MRASLLDLLICTSCRADARLRMSVRAEERGEILEGELSCTHCQARFPIVRGTPRFVASQDDYCGNFGFQWQRWNSIQIDGLGGHHMSEDRFFDQIPWDREWMKEKLILDAGCGAGRFTDVALRHGAHVVACDISDAIDACRENTRGHADQVHTVHASLYALPFREGTFDAAYCFGVIQHTPDPKQTMETLPRFVKPRGHLVYDFYERTPWEKPWVPHFYLRRYTPQWPAGRLLALSQILTAIFFVPGWLMARLPVVQALCPMLPIAICANPQLALKYQYQWTVCDTFDWYGPQFEQRQHYREVATLLSRMGLQDILGRPGTVSARIPDALRERNPAQSSKVA